MKKSKNIMILGGNGFIGKNLARYLTRLDYSVSIFDLKEPEEKIPGVRYLCGDFFDDQSIPTILEGQDTVIHALSTINPGNSNACLLRGYAGDFVQTVKLFQEACLRDIRIIFMSSAGTVYGRYDGKPFFERHALQPINHYGSIKVCIETAMRSFNEQQHGRLISCRITNPYGPGQDYRKGVGFIDAVIKNYVNNTTLEIWGDGSVIRDYIYIDDVCNMMEKLIDYDGQWHVFNISTGIGHSQLDIMDIFNRLGCDVKVKFLEARSVDAKINLAANDRILQATGVHCIDLEEGITKYLQSLQIV